MMALKAYLKYKVFLSRIHLVHYFMTRKKSEATKRLLGNSPTNDDV